MTHTLCPLTCPVCRAFLPELVCWLFHFFYTKILTTVPLVGSWSLRISIWCLAVEKRIMFFFLLEAGWYLIDLSAMNKGGSNKTSVIWKLDKLWGNNKTDVIKKGDSIRAIHYLHIILWGRSWVHSLTDEKKSMSCTTAVWRKRAIVIVLRQKLQQKIWQWGFAIRLTRDHKDTEHN